MEQKFVNWPAKGFTLIELMVTLLVLAILASVGIPAFQRLVAENRVSSQANATQGALQFARSEALKRRGDVVMCQAGTSIIVRAGSQLRQCL
jgi:type IV fimbrial biogenesis protein FimT